MSSQKKVTIEAIEESSGESVKKGQKSRLDLLEMKYRSLVCEKRMMFVMFLLTLLGTLLFIISFSTPYWIYVSLSKLQERSDNRGSYMKIGHYHGLWRICREEYWPLENSTNATEFSEFCRPMYFSLPDWMKTLPEKRYNMELKMLDFRRSTIAVGFIALMMAFLTHCFTYFSLDQLRYMYKRLTGCLCLIAGACCWVTLEVFRQMHMYEEENMKTFVKEFRAIKYGWSYNLIWFVIVLYLIPGIAFLLLSKKKKRSKARSLKEARENEPVHLGR